MGTGLCKDTQINTTQVDSQGLPPRAGRGDNVTMTG
jgi:hypothetical protein